MKSFNKFKLGLTALMLCSGLTALADDSLQIHGFFMNGSDFSTEESRVNLALHRDPNFDPRGKLGDLGNSYWHDYFTAISLNKKWEGKDGSWADFTYELVSYGNKAVEAGQSYARFGGLSMLPEGSEVWAGRRNFSKRDSVFAYNLKDIGVDAGVGYNSENFDITFGFCQNLRAESIGIISAPDEVGPPIKINGNSRNVVDATFKFGAIEAGVTLVNELEDGKFAIKDNTQEPRSAMSYYGAYNMDKFLGIMDGKTTVMAQFGKGVIAQYLNTSRIDMSAEDDTSMRISVNGNTNLGELSVSPSVILETTSRDADGMETETSLFAGASAAKKVTDNIVMHYEANVSNTTNVGGADGVDGSMYKIAAGPSIQLDPMPWVAPQISVVASYVGGDKEVTLIKDDEGKAADSEFRLGYELKAWF
jgi:hypothetical protein